jgi:hypothetical protein
VGGREPAKHESGCGVLIVRVYLARLGAVRRGEAAAAGEGLGADRLLAEHAVLHLRLLRRGLAQGWHYRM